MCHNCDDLPLKHISSVIDHVWGKHGIEVTKIWRPLLRSEDARLPKRRSGKRRSGFRCEKCNVSLSNISSLLNHLDREHGIHVWYEKGLLQKRVYYDGVLEDALTEEVSEKREYIPLSQLPYEPRTGDKDKNETI